MSFCECGDESSGSINCGGRGEELLAFRVGLYCMEAVRLVETLAEITPL